MIPLLPNPFNPEDTEFVLDADSFMAALVPDQPATARFLLEQEVAQARKALLNYERMPREPSTVDAHVTGRADRPTPGQRSYAPDAAGRRVDAGSPTPIPDEDALFYLAGSEPLSIAPDHPQDGPKRK